MAAIGDGSFRNKMAEIYRGFRHKKNIISLPFTKIFSISFYYLTRTPEEELRWNEY
jgi:hypothetical protein